ncbi:hypothetical protein GCM10022276_11930 [Sphingomonas limnosediminicola]|jgi:hypothetical protein|uniref:Uncharacterized protein n=1 Tax=Sphingomonas limnosediminicola TaxID=940133 RepID=A0ABP7L4V7_9SPHN
MLNVRLNAARKIADALIPSEADIETAIASTSRLIAAIAEGRAETNLPVAMGQDSLAALSATMAALIEARGKIATAHQALAQDRIDAGLRAYGMGDVSDCPSTGALGLVEMSRSAA